MISTLEDAQYELWAMRKDAEADFGDEVEINHADLVVSACFNLEDVAVARELCRVELGYVPHELRARLGNVDWLE